MSRPSHNVRRCAPCDADWPATSTYNLCPRCQRNTHASTADARPDAAEAAKQLARYNTIREFDAKADAAAAERHAAWAAEMNALLELSPNPAPPAVSPQDVTYPWQAGPTDA